MAMCCREVQRKPKDSVFLFHQEWSERCMSTQSEVTHAVCHKKGAEEGLMS